MIPDEEVDQGIKVSNIIGLTDLPTHQEACVPCVPSRRPFRPFRVDDGETLQDREPIKPASLSLSIRASLASMQHDHDRRIAARPKIIDHNGTSLSAFNCNRNLARILRVSRVEGER